MRPTLALAALVSALTLAPGCAIYFGDDTGDDDCQWGGGDMDGAEAAPIGLRNPQTGQCEYFDYGGGGGGGCDPACGPCPPYDDSDRAPLPSWGYCESSCTWLDEQTCQATAGCRAAYLETCGENTPCDVSANRAFLGCWAVDQSGPIQGSCENLDAWSCSLHDDCLAVHYDICNSWGTDPGGGGAPLIDPSGCVGDFLACLPEVSEQTGCYSDAECNPDEYCNAAEVCLPPPGCQTTDENGISECEAVCYGWCVPGDPPPPPPPPPPACEELLTEDACVARDDCAPLYEGVNCTCDANGCTCEDWLFVSCSSVLDPTDPPADQ